MKVTINVEFAIGDTVQLKLPNTEDQHLRGLVVGYNIALGEIVLYKLCYPDANTGYHYDIELEKIDL